MDNCDEDNQQGRDDVIDRIITGTISDDNLTLESILELATPYEIAQAIRYMESDERERIIGLISSECSEKVLSVLGEIEDEADIADMEELENKEEESEDQGLEEVPQQIDVREYEEYSWVHIIAPDENEIKNLSDDLDIPLDFLTSPLDIDERSRIEVDGKNILVILRTPYFDEESDIPYKTLPLGIILTENVIITVCSTKNDIIQAFADGKIRDGLSTVNKVKFILQMFSGASLVFMEYLKEINKQTSIAESKVLKSMRNEELIELLNYEKSLVYFTTSLKSNELVLGRLQRTELIEMSDDDREQLEDVIIENRQAIEMTNIYSNILSGMMDAFASIISNNLNSVMKLLASITIILTIPVLVASIYGMNIELPIQHSPYAFLITMGSSLALSILGAIILIKKKWL